MPGFQAQRLEDFAQALAAGLPPELASRKAGYRRHTRRGDMQRRLEAAAPRVAEIQRHRRLAAADIGGLAERLERMAADILAAPTPDAPRLREARQALADAGRIRAILHQSLAAALPPKPSEPPKPYEPPKRYEPPEPGIAPLSPDEWLAKYGVD